MVLLKTITFKQLSQETITSKQESLQTITSKQKSQETMSSKQESPHSNRSKEVFLLVLYRAKEYKEVLSLSKQDMAQLTMAMGYITKYWASGET